MENIKNLTIEQLKNRVDGMAKNSGDVMQATNLVEDYFGEDAVNDYFESVEVLNKDVVAMGLKAQISDVVEDVDNPETDTELLVDLSTKLDEVLNDNVQYFDYSTDFYNIEPIDEDELLDLIDYLGGK